MLIGTINDLLVDRNVSDRLLVLANEAQTLQIIRRKEAGDQSRMREANLPEMMMQAVGHKAKWRHFLRRGDFADVLAKLFLTLAGIARSSLRFNYSKDGAIGMIEAIIGEAIPGPGVVTIDRYFELDLRAIAQIPTRFL
jgi:hypothetical protein